MSLSHLYEMTHSTPNMLNSDFLFVQVQTTGKVPPQRDVRTAIQKHVMRKIGVARRGQPRPQRRPEDIRQRKTHKGRSPENIVLRNFPDRCSIQEGSSKDIVTTQDLAYMRAGAEVPLLVSGGCRTDPFMCFPIKMNSGAYSLIDYCKWTK